MRLLLVNALPLDHLGGAEISFREHLKETPDGVVVDTILPHEDVELSAYDAVILGNLRPVAQASAPRRPTLKRRLWKLLRHSPLDALTVRSETAAARLWCHRLKGYDGYVIKSERDVHPCVRRDARCLDLNTMQRHRCGATRTVACTFERLYNLCDAVQFLSPLHRRAINMLVKVEVAQYEIAPSIDLKLFRNDTPFEQRKNAALVTGDKIRVSSGAWQRARDAGYEPEQLDYLSVPYERMPEVLNRYRAVVMEPVMLHAFGRLAAEALACGCRVLASERVGAMSWEDPLAACRESNTRFWEMVMNRPAGPNPRRLCR